MGLLVEVINDRIPQNVQMWQRSFYGLGLIQGGNISRMVPELLEQWVHTAVVCHRTYIFDVLLDVITGTFQITQKDVARGNVILSFGKDNTEVEADFFVETFAKAVVALREMSLEQ